MAGSVFQGAFKVGSNSLTNVTGMNWSDTAAGIISQVVGQSVDKHYAGTANVSGTVNFEVLQTDVTVVGTNFARGTTGTGELHFFGDTATYLELTTTKITIMSIDISGAINGICAGTINWVADDITIQAAS